MPVPLLRVTDVQISFKVHGHWLPAVTHASFDIHAGEIVGLVGESGSGKSVTALSILGLLPRIGRITGGRIQFKGEDLLNTSPHTLRRVRGKQISWIPQEVDSLNPVLTIAEQLGEVFLLHHHLKGRDALRRAASLLATLGIDSPQARLKQYPHELSGGMRQRVLIAMALACEPDLLIADEPTTALDVTVQADILRLMNKMRHQFNLSMLLITHDLGVVAEMCDRIVVMYAGTVVEMGSARQVLESPRHPYTVGLIRSIPSWTRRAGRLDAIQGAPPALGILPQGCRFHPRCVLAGAECRQEVPRLREAEAGHLTRCLRFEEVEKLLDEQGVSSFGALRGK